MPFWASFNSSQVKELPSENVAPTVAGAGSGAGAGAGTTPLSSILTLYIIVPVQVPNNALEILPTVMFLVTVCATVSLPA